MTEPESSIPPWLVASADLAEQMSRLLRVAVAPSAEIEQAVEAMRYSVDVSAQMQEAVEQLRRHYAAVVKPEFHKAMESVTRMVRGSIPDNWEPEFAGIDLFDLIAESGVCLVWVPRANIVKAMLDAPEGDLGATLTATSGVVLDDLTTVLERARGASVAGHGDGCAFAAEAIAAARGSHWSAAQALAATGLTHVVQHIHCFPHISEARKKFEERDFDNATMQVIKITLLELCSARALAKYEPGYPPETFNRHASLHGERKSYSQANALVGLLLLVGWLREFKWDDET